MTLEIIQCLTKVEHLSQEINKNRCMTVDLA